MFAIIAVFILGSAPAIAETFPNDELMQANKTYDNAATYENTGVYSDSVDAEANYDWDDITVPAGKYLPAGQTAVEDCSYDSYCPGLAQPVHYDAQNSQGAIACDTVGDGSYIYSDSEESPATSETQCYRDCDAANMGTTIPNYPHAVLFDGGTDYYGGTANDDCRIEFCEVGWHVDYNNNTCVANTITINWNGATAAAISANNAGTTTYGSDIRTPQSVDSSLVPAGKRFVGWKFSKPSGVSLAPYFLSAIGESERISENTGWQGTGGGDNASMYGLSDQMWGITLNNNLGKVRGEARCSDTNNGKSYGQVGNPGNSTTGQYCWCRATGYQANGDTTWQNVLPSSWVFFDAISEYCVESCAYQCSNRTSQGRFGAAVFGMTQ